MPGGPLEPDNRRCGAMHVIGINGSPRKKNNSGIMLEHAMEGAKSVGAATELFDLVDLQYSGCRSCFACKKIGGNSFGRCAVNDDLKAILDRILAADAVIVSSPIYFGDVPGMVRNLFERLWFPGHMYMKDGSCAYDKTVKVGLIYTMNVPDARLYQQLTEFHKRTFERFLGPAQVLCAADTLQYDDYRLYVGDMFDGAHKQQHHDAQFPADCQNAFALGARLASA